MEPSRSRRALISVWNKEGIVEFAEALTQQNWEIIATDGSQRLLQQNGIKSQNTNSVTHLPTFLGGRVKTLDPNVFGGLLFRRGNESDESEMAEFNVRPIDLVICNFYPFSEKAKSDLDLDTMLSFIDVGGPAMIRAAAKNFHSVLPIVDPSDYSKVSCYLQSTNSVPLNHRLYLGIKALRHTSDYDELISNYLAHSYIDKSIATQVD